MICSKLIISWKWDISLLLLYITVMFMLLFTMSLWDVDSYLAKFLAYNKHSVFVGQTTDNLIWCQMSENFAVAWVYGNDSKSVGYKVGCKIFWLIVSYYKSLGIFKKYLLPVLLALKLVSVHHVPFFLKYVCLPFIVWGKTGPYSINL